MNFTIDDLVLFIDDLKLDVRHGPKSIVIPGTELCKFDVATLPVPVGMRCKPLPISIEEQVNHKVALKENPLAPEPIQALCISKSISATPEALKAKLESILEPDPAVEASK